MKNRFFERFKNTLLLRVTGKNLERFIHRLNSHKIEILKLEYQKVDTIKIKVYEKDLKKIKDLKSVYEIEILGEYGKGKLKKEFKKNRIFSFYLLLGILFLVLISNVITRIEVIHTDKNLRGLLLKEFSNYGIVVPSFKKSFAELEKIKKEILERHKDSLEWLEIERVGTKYLIRVEERKIEEEEKEEGPRNIVAKKSAIIREIHAESGEVVKNMNDYVNPGDVIISGEIKLYDELKNVTTAKGKVFGEVWYQTKVEYPFIYKEEYKTGKKKQVLGIHFLNYFFPFFDFHPFQKKETIETVLWKHPFLPVSFAKCTLEEVRVIEDIYTEEEAALKAVELGKKQMEEKLKNGEKILDYRNLKVLLKESKIEVDIFFTVLEDITSYQAIEAREGE